MLEVNRPISSATSAETYAGLRAHGDQGLRCLSSRHFATVGPFPLLLSGRGASLGLHTGFSREDSVAALQQTAGMARSPPGLDKTVEVLQSLGSIMLSSRIVREDVSKLRKLMAE